MYIVHIGQMVGNIVLLYFDKNNYGIAYKINYLFFRYSSYIVWRIQAMDAE